MRPYEALRWLEAGGFYARLDPLALCQVKSPGQLADGGPGCHILHQWCPTGEDDVTWLDPKSTDFRYLWFNYVVPIGALSSYGTEPTSFYVGDVLIVGEKHDSLIFIGPDTRDKQVHVLADWRPILAEGMKLSFIDVFQPGPGRKTLPPKTVYEHMRAPII